MTPLQTNDGIVLAQNIDDLKELFIDKCGYEVWDFIKYAENSDKGKMQEEINNLKSDNYDFEQEINDLNKKLNKAKEKIKDLKKELKSSKPDPVIVPIESLKKTKIIETIEEIDDDECIPF